MHPFPTPSFKANSHTGITALRARCAEPMPVLAEPLEFLAVPQPHPWQVQTPRMRTRPSLCKEPAQGGPNFLRLPNKRVQPARPIRPFLAGAPKRAFLFVWYAYIIIFSSNTELFSINRLGNATSLSRGGLFLSLYRLPCCGIVSSIGDFIYENVFSEGVYTHSRCQDDGTCHQVCEGHV